MALEATLTYSRRSKRHPWPEKFGAAEKNEGALGSGRERHSWCGRARVETFRSAFLTTWFIEEFEHCSGANQLEVNLD